MPVDIDSLEGHIIRKMVPFSTMPSSIFKVICDKISVETAKSGTFLFKRGDTTKELVYLLKGEVSLEVDKLKMEVIKAGTESARFALAHQIPRKVNGVAKGTVQFLRLNSIYITTPELVTPKKQDAAATAKEHEQSRISTLLMIPILKGLPPTQLAKINEYLEEVHYQEGDIVVKQGDVGEYYYLITKGECVMSHKETTLEQTLTVSKLKMWDSFGAEALICDTLRNHTVTALSSLSLLRINKDSFLPLVKEPLLKVLDEIETDVLLHNNAVLLDVRTEKEYETSHLPEAINAPLLGLRNHLKHLDIRRPVLVTSTQQNLSAAAAFLLMSYKFSASVSAKSPEFISTKFTINIRQPVNHSFIAEDAASGESIFLDLFDVDQEQTENRVISTRSPIVHSSPQDSLVAENASLEQQLSELKIKAEKAEREKQEIMQKYQRLLKQSERLKAMLESLTK